MTTAITHLMTKLIFTASVIILKNTANGVNQYILVVTLLYSSGTCLSIISTTHLDVYVSFNEANSHGSVLQL